MLNTMKIPMTATIRAYRILRYLTPYKSAEHLDQASSIANSDILGNLLGCYFNQNQDNGSVKVFDFGLEWMADDVFKSIQYVDIDDLTVDVSKPCEIKLLLRNGQTESLPIDGHVGKFYDSLEFLRFLMRVRADLL